jgi:hypothetical protein
MMERIILGISRKEETKHYLKGMKEGNEYTKKNKWMRKVKTKELKRARKKDKR